MLLAKFMGAAIQAPEFVGGRTFTASGSAGDIVIPIDGLSGGLAAAPAAGDLVVLAVSINRGVDLASSVLADYTSAVDAFANDTEDTNLLVSHRFMPGTPETQATLTGGTGSTSAALAVAVHVWRYIDTVTPLDVAAQVATQTNTAEADPPSITPATTGAVVLSIGAAGTNFGTALLENTAGLDNFFNATGNDSDDSMIAIGSEVFNGGAIDNVAFNYSATDGSSFSSIGASIALRPA